MNKEKPSESELVARLKSRDRGALDLLYSMYSAALYGAIHRMVRSDETAEDLLQETFVKIWRNIPNYDPSKGRLFTWLLRIARNAALDKLKSKEFRDGKKNQGLEDVVNAVEKQTRVLLEPDTIGLRELTDRLTPDQKEVIDLIYFQGYTQLEASEELRIPLGTVKTRIRAAINVLRKVFSSTEQLQ